MLAKYISLYQLTKLIDNEMLSEKYVRYLCGFPSSRKYRHDEVLAVYELLKDTSLTTAGADGFLYGYTIPQLSKEFDLLKITSNYVINIELKGQDPGETQRKKQLSQNAHYLKMLGKKLRLFSYVSSRHKLYELVDGKMIDVDFSILQAACVFSGDAPDLDKIFEPKNILVSPLNEPTRFLRGEYLLTDRQEEIKCELFKKMGTAKSFFFGITGAPGTGKTLLLYDIAVTLARKGSNILVIHTGKLCDGHTTLSLSCPNLEIIPVKYLRYREIKRVDYVLIDEAQRLWPSALDKIEKWFEKANTLCIFSYDPEQRLSHTEYHMKTAEKICYMCGENSVKLKGRIRTNKELAGFIEALFDLKKRKKGNYENVKIYFESNKKEAVSFAKSLKKSGYQYIAITPSYFKNDLDFQSDSVNSHRVIGQEFDKVCMILGDYFCYYNGKLSAVSHPNPDYMTVKLLYQGLTRARTGIALVITNPDLLGEILSIVSDND